MGEQSLPRIFVVSPLRLGGLDVVLPLLLGVREIAPDAKITAIVLSRRAWDTACSDPFLSKVIGECFSRIRFLSQTPLGEPGRKLIFRLSTISVLLGLFFSSRPVLLHSGDVSGGITGLFAKVAWLRGGKVLRYTNTHAITLGREPEKDDEPSGEGDGILCFSRAEADFHKKGGCRNPVIVGFPRLFNAWVIAARDFAAEAGKNIVPGSVDINNNNAVSIFLGSTVKGVFNEEELDTGFEIILRVVRRQNPEACILIKPHPLQNKEQVARFADMLDNEREIITSVHPAVLAAISRYTVTFATSTIIDALGMRDPIIMHQPFTEHWMQRHPEGSSYLELGIEHSQNEEQLTEAITKVKADSYRVPDIRKILHHHEDLSVFYAPKEKSATS